MLCVLVFIYWYELFFFGSESIWILLSISYFYHSSLLFGLKFKNYAGSFRASSWIRLTTLTCHLIHPLMKSKSNIVRCKFVKHFPFDKPFPYSVTLSNMLTWITCSYLCLFTLTSASIHKQRRHLAVRKLFFLFVPLYIPFILGGSLSEGLFYLFYLLLVG